MNTAFHAAVVIGRFQPFYCSQAALRMAVVLGVAFQARDAVDWLRKETGFALFESKLEAALAAAAVLDRPNRRDRGRTMSPCGVSSARYSEADRAKEPSRLQRRACEENHLTPGVRLKSVGACVESSTFRQAKPRFGPCFRQG